MPFKSQAQRRKFAALLVQGKISPETFEEWNRETGSAKLPEYVATKKAKKAKTKSRSASKTGSKRKNTRASSRRKATSHTKKKRTRTG